MTPSLIPAAGARLAPDLRVSQWFGESARLVDLRGRVVVLHAFQMLCPGCVLHGIPQASRIHATFDPDDIQVIGLHTVFEHHDAMGPTSLAAFLHEFRVPFPVAVDSPVEGADVPHTMSAYGLRGTPSLVLIDRQGRLRANWFGRPDDLVVGASIATLIADRELSARVPERVHPDGCSDEGCAVPAAHPGS